MGTDPDMRTFCYLLDEKRVVIGGGADSVDMYYEWLKNDLLQTKIPLEKLRPASLAPPGCEGLLMVPYLFGGEEFPGGMSGSAVLFTVSESGIAASILSGPPWKESYSTFGS